MDYPNGLPLKNMEQILKVLFELFMLACSADISSGLNLCVFCSVVVLFRSYSKWRLKEMRGDARLCGTTRKASSVQCNRSFLTTTHLKLYFLGVVHFKAVHLGVHHGSPWTTVGVSVKLKEIHGL